MAKTRKEHGDTPWAVDKRSRIVDANGVLIADCGKSGYIGFKVDEANAQRAVECVNFCEHFDSADLIKLKSLAEAIDPEILMEAAQSRAYAGLLQRLCDNRRDLQPSGSPHLTACIEALVNGLIAENEQLKSGDKPKSNDKSGQYFYRQARWNTDTQQFEIRLGDKEHWRDVSFFVNMFKDKPELVFITAVDDGYVATFVENEKS